MKGQLARIPNGKQKDRRAHACALGSRCRMPHDCARVRLRVWHVRALLPPWHLREHAQRCAREHSLFLACSNNSSRRPIPFLFLGGAAMMMDCNAQLPRLAFGHLDQEDGCIEQEDGLAVDVAVTAVSGEKLCNIALKSRDQVQHLKTRLASTLRVPESDQTLLLSNGRRLGAKRRLRSVLPSGSETITLVVSQPACRRCGVRDGLWGRRAKLIQCPHCFDAYYCSRECQMADADAHFRCDRH